MPALSVLVATTTGPQGPNSADVSPGLLGFITIFVLALATVVLVRSMVKHLRKVRYSPGPDGQMWTPPGPVGAPTAPQAPAAPSDGEEPAPKA